MGTPTALSGREGVLAPLGVRMEGDGAAARSGVALKVDGEAKLLWRASGGDMVGDPTSADMSTLARPVVAVDGREAWLGGVAKVNEDDALCCARTMRGRVVVGVEVWDSEPPMSMRPITWGRARKRTKG